MDHSIGQFEIKVWVTSRTPISRSYRSNIALSNPYLSSLWLGEDYPKTRLPLTDERKQEIREELKFPVQAIDLADQIFQMRQADGYPLFSDVFVRFDEIAVFPLTEPYWPDIDSQISEMVKAIYQSFV